MGGNRLYCGMNEEYFYGKFDKKDVLYTAITRKKEIDLIRDKELAIAEEKMENYYREKSENYDKLNWFRKLFTERFSSFDLFILAGFEDDIVDAINYDIKGYNFCNSIINNIDMTTDGTVSLSNSGIEQLGGKILRCQE